MKYEEIEVLASSASTKLFALNARKTAKKIGSQQTKEFLSEQSKTCSLGPLILQRTNTEEKLQRCN